MVGYEAALRAPFRSARSQSWNLGPASSFGNRFVHLIDAGIRLAILRWVSNRLCCTSRCIFLGKTSIAFRLLIMSAPHKTRATPSSMLACTDSGILLKTLAVCGPKQR